MLICFNGIDGAGKSSQALALVERLKATGHEAVYMWSGSRTPLTRPFTRLAKKLLRRSTARSDESAGAPAAIKRSYLPSSRRLLRNPLLRQTWLHFSLAEHALKIWLTIPPHLVRNQIVVCDRYLYDSAITTALLSGLDPDGVPALLREAGWWRVPRPDYWFFLDLPPEVAIQRKGDPDELDLLLGRAPLYRAAASSLGMTLIDATCAPEEIGESIFRQVRQSLPPVMQPPNSVGELP